jgi:hypothetical protein
VRSHLLHAYYVAMAGDLTAVFGCLLEEDCQTLIDAVDKEFQAGLLNHTGN